MHPPGTGPVEDEPTVDLEKREVRADENRMIGRVLDFYLDRHATGVEHDRPIVQDHLPRRHRLSAAGVTAVARERIGCSTWSTRIPSPNRHSILMAPMSEGTPSRTSSVVMTFSPIRITSSYDAPPRAASCISSQMIASASGCVSFHPLARRRRASSAAVKMVSRSISVGVSLMLASLSLGTRQSEHRIEQHVRTSLDVRWRRELFWTVTAALTARHEDHSDVRDARHDLRIVHRTTGHPHS